MIYTQFDLSYTMIEWGFLCIALLATTFDQVVLTLIVGFVLCGLLFVDPTLFAAVALFYWQKTIYDQR